MLNPIDWPSNSGGTFGVILIPVRAALHMFELGVLRLNPCCGLRPWQLLVVVPQAALASPYIGAGARSNCCPNIGSEQGTELRYHFEVAFRVMRGLSWKLRTLAATQSKCSTFLCRLC